MQEHRNKKVDVNAYRDTDADGLPDRIDPQYSYPPAERAKEIYEKRRVIENQDYSSRR